MGWFADMDTRYLLYQNMFGEAKGKPKPVKQIYPLMDKLMNIVNRIEPKKHDLKAKARLTGREAFRRLDSDSEG